MKDEILYDTGVDLNSFGRESTFLSVKAAINMQLRTDRYCRFVENKVLTITWQGEVSPCYASCTAILVTSWDEKRICLPIALET